MSATVIETSADAPATSSHADAPANHGTAYAAPAAGCATKTWRTTRPRREPVFRTGTVTLVPVRVESARA
ncbi:hypothetical protein P9139_01245 [Curtobacterium flaccumfaciens]|nr:hypothetical protein P9139_01245 [Curtobacterium flaccumfaciens]